MNLLIFVWDIHSDWIVSITYSDWIVSITYLSVLRSLKSHDSSVGIIALGYGLDDRSSGFDSRRGLGIFLFTTAFRTALGPTQPPIQWVPGALSLGIRRPGCEAEHSPPSSAEVKNACSYTSTPQYVFMAWCLVKHRDNFTFTFTFTFSFTFY
jgi:hypothetical protein